MTKTVPARLITIICGNEIEGRLSTDLKTVGVRAYTMSRATGRGTHGPRVFDIADMANVRIELLVPPSQADLVLGMPR